MTVWVALVPEKEGTGSVVVVVGVNFHLSIDRVPAEFGQEARNTFAEELKHRKEQRPLNTVEARMLQTCLDTMAIEIKQEEEESIVGIK